MIRPAKHDFSLLQRRTPTCNRHLPLRSDHPPSSYIARARKRFPIGTGAVFDAGAAAGFRQARREPSVPHNDRISMFIRSAPTNASLSYGCRTGSFTNNVGSVLVIWIVMFLSRPCRHHHAISESQLAFRDSTTLNAQPRGDGDGYGYRRANSCWTN